MSANLTFPIMELLNHVAFPFASHLSQAAEETNAAHAQEDEIQCITYDLNTSDSLF